MELKGDPLTLLVTTVMILSGPIPAVAGVDLFQLDENETAGTFPPPMAIPRPEDGTTNVAIFTPYSIYFTDIMNTTIYPTIEPEPRSGSWGWDTTANYCNYTGEGGYPIWAPGTEYTVNVSLLKTVGEVMILDDTEFVFTTDGNAPIVNNVITGPTDHVSFHNHFRVQATVSDAGMILMSGMLLMEEAGGNDTLNNYTLVEQVEGVLTPTGLGSIYTLEVGWNATIGYGDNRTAGYLTDGAELYHVDAATWHEMDGLHIGTDVYFNNDTYEDVEGEMHFLEDGQPSGLWIKDPISEWIDPMDFDSEMTVTPRVDVISFTMTGELASEVGTSVYVKAGPEIPLPDISFDEDHLVPSGEYDWSVMAVDGGMNIDLELSATPLNVDNLRPILSTSIENGAENISTDIGEYRIHFSEPMNVSRGLISSNLPGAVWNWSADATWINCTFTGLRGGEEYYIYMGSGFSDLAGNPLPEHHRGRNFTTGFPWATVTGPVSGGTNNNTPTITYEYGNNATEVIIYFSTDGGETWTSWVWDDTVDGVYEGVETDGIGWSGIYQWNARATAEVSEPEPGGPESIECGPYIIDMDRPMVNSTTPGNWDYDIRREASTFVIEFTEPMNTSTFSINSTLPEVIWEWDGTGIYLNGTYGELAGETQYYVNLTGEGFLDLVGNQLGGTMEYQFRTELGPYADAGGYTSPGTYDIRPHILYSANNLTTSVEIYYTDDGGLTWTLWGVDEDVNETWIPDSDLPGPGTYNWNARAMGYVNEPIPDGPEDVESGAWVLLNPEDWISIIDTYPEDMVTGIGLTSGTYVIQFDKEMDTGSGTPDTNLPDVTWTWSADGRYLNGSYGMLEPLTMYYVNLEDGGFRGVSGHPLWGDTYKTFTTRTEGEVGTGRIEGTVVDGDGEPIAGAEVKVKGTDIVTTTDENGHYILENVPVGEQVVEISHPDYEDLELDVSVSEGETTQSGTKQLSESEEKPGGLFAVICLMVMILVILLVPLILVVVIVAVIVKAARGKKSITEE